MQRTLLHIHVYTDNQKNMIKKKQEVEKKNKLNQCGYYDLFVCP